MGLKKQNYAIEELGITLPEAYCLVTSVRMDRSVMRVVAEIQQTREATSQKEPLERVFVNGPFDITQPSFPQAYALVKQQLGDGWGDDIVTQ
jgi:hypothetical protein